jgi:threonylcarbamoyladenosine tRNA methylthiotransferase MtaB
MNIHLQSLGCRLNEAELENWATAFHADGHTLTGQPEEADLIVVNTCAVTHEAIKKSRQLIRRSHRNNPDAKLVVSGCYGTLNPGLNQDIAAIDLLVHNQDKDKLVEIVRRELALEAAQNAATTPGETALFQRGRQRAFIKVQDGCRYHCTFCIVTVARGSERSNSIHQVIDQINRLQHAGIQEAVLTGVHIGGYGSDIGESLDTLIKAILADTAIPRLRIASLEPWDLPENFLELFNNSRLMPHLHLPLQSGCDAVLKRMGRRCKTAEFANIVRAARNMIPDFNITTDIIAGFPGETDDNWQQGLEFIRQIGFAHIHIFPYSPRPGTAAASMAGQVSPGVKKSRCRELHTLAAGLWQEFAATQLQKIKPVLFERAVMQGVAVYSGYTDNYLRVEVPTNRNLAMANTIAPVRMESLAVNGEAMHGVLL